MCTNYGSGVTLLWKTVYDKKLHTKIFIGKLKNKYFPEILSLKWVEKYIIESIFERQISWKYIPCSFILFLLIEILLCNFFIIKGFSTTNTSIDLVHGNTLAIICAFEKSIYTFRFTFDNCWDIWWETKRYVSMCLFQQRSMYKCL